jgi:hypothetical protein
LVAQGSAARIGCGVETAPVDAAIVTVKNQKFCISLTPTDTTALIAAIPSPVQCLEDQSRKCSG